MARATKMKYGFPIALFIWLYLDGIMGAAFQHQMFHYPYAMSSYLVILWLVFAVLFEGPHDNHLEIWAAIAGGVFDLYYTGILGVFVFVFPIIVVVTKFGYKELPMSFLSGLLIVFIVVTLASIASYISILVTHLNPATLGDMLVYSLGPSLAYNLAAFVILYYPIRRFFDWMGS